MTKQPTAAVLLIGDELLSGRTRDINLSNIANFLTPYGIPVKECRTVSDEQDDIVEAVNALRTKYTYVFTTGGIGPTHDDITADAIAAAFGVGISKHPEVMAFLQKRYDEMETEFTEPRQRMARFPHGAELIDNPVSGAPGIQMENVFTMAGVPSIARSMLESIGPKLQTGAVIHKITISGKGLREGDIAEKLGALSDDMPGVSFGSYPWFKSLQDNGVQIVASSTDEGVIADVEKLICDLVTSVGVTPEKV